MDLAVVKKESESEEQCVGAMQYKIVHLSGVDRKYITVKVQSQTEKDLYYRIGMNMNLKFLMNDYCKRIGFGLDTLRFFATDGTRLKETHTPLELQMEDDDAIDAFSVQLGG